MASMEGTKLSDDYWHSYVYVNFSWLGCGECNTDLDVEWAWDGITAEGEAGVQQFTNRVVPHLKSAGWIIHDAALCCPACAARLGVTDETISH
jgi:hypothetical protein